MPFAVSFHIERISLLFLPWSPDVSDCAPDLSVAPSDVFPSGAGGQVALRDETVEEDGDDQDQ